MKLQESTLLELKEILEQEFNLTTSDKDLSKVAYSLVGYFDLLLKVENRHKFGNSPDRAIDSSTDSVLDEKEVK